ncbi:MAG: dickkopf-related protein, partial [Gaiellaceae bacterium]
SATGAALVTNVALQDLPFSSPLPEATLRFNFQVKSAAALASVTDRTIIILVRALDNAMPPLDCTPHVISVTATTPGCSGARTAEGCMPCGRVPAPGEPTRCNDPGSSASIVVEPAQGFTGDETTVKVTITGPAAAQVAFGAVVGPLSCGSSSGFLARQSDGSLQGTGNFPRTAGPVAVAFTATDDRGNALCCGSTTLTSRGPCQSDGDCGAGMTCNVRSSESAECVRRCTSDSDCCYFCDKFYGRCEGF